MRDDFSSFFEECVAGLDLLDRQRAMRKALTAAPASFGAGVGDLGADIRRSTGKIRATAAGFRREAARLRTLRVAVATTSAATAALTAEARRDLLRRGMHEVMAKAMNLFEQGAISGHEVRTLESRVNKIGEVLSL